MNDEAAIDVGPAEAITQRDPGDEHPEGEEVHNADQPGEPVADLNLAEDIAAAEADLAAGETASLEEVESELGYDALIGDLHTWIVSSLDLAEGMAKQKPSRELALVLTKLEEAEMWLIKLFPNTSEEVSQ